MYFTGVSVSKESACSGRDLGSVPESGRPSGEGNGNLSSILASRIPGTECGRIRSILVLFIVF